MKCKIVKFLGLFRRGEEVSTESRFRVQFVRLNSKGNHQRDKRGYSLVEFKTEEGTGTVNLKSIQKEAGESVRNAGERETTK